MPVPGNGPGKVAVVTLSARTRAAARLGLLTSSLSRRMGRGEGMVIGGRVILRLAPTRSPRWRMTGWRRW